MIIGKEAVKGPKGVRSGSEINDELLSDPSAINVDKYGGGWLFKTKGSGEGLLTIDEYLQHLETSWEVAQRTIKGQIQ